MFANLRKRKRKTGDVVVLERSPSHLILDPDHVPAAPSLDRERGRRRRRRDPTLTEGDRVVTR